MRDFPYVRIVVSSTWRHQFTLDQLRARFSSDIAVRIIGVTPGVERVEGRYLPAQREDEILKWLAQNECEGVQWVALR